MNSYGTKFRLSIFGESHGPLIGVVLDGVPAGMPLSREDFLADLDRRRSGAKGSTPRKESDLPEIVSGVCDGHTTGAPLTIVFRNSNTRSGDYSDFRATPRPGHADFVAERKYRAFNDLRGGGRARITELGGIPRERLNCEPGRELGAEGAPTLWDELIDRTLRELDSVGGVIECTCDKVPVGLGEPFFDSLESQLAHLAFSIPAVRGIEFGDGFAAARMKGSEHNDCFVNGEGKTATNGAGGINGGISNGNPVVFRVAVKPTSSIAKKQYTFNFATGRMEEFVVKGRHDACIALRCPVVVEAIAAIALANN